MDSQSATKRGAVQCLRGRSGQDRRGVAPSTEGFTPARTDRDDQVDIPHPKPTRVFEPKTKPLRELPSNHWVGSVLPRDNGVTDRAAVDEDAAPLNPGRLASSTLTASVVSRPQKRGLIDLATSRARRAPRRQSSDCTDLTEPVCFSAWLAAGCAQHGDEPIS